MAKKHYNRLPSKGETHGSEQDHELQDLSGRQHEEEVNLLSSFVNHDMHRSNNDQSDHSSTNDDNRVITEDADARNGTLGFVPFESSSSSSQPHTSVQGENAGHSSDASGTASTGAPRVRVQIPNTIIHKLINNPRVSKYVPHLIRNYYQPVYNGRPMGQGLNNDGVFTNMSAKPSTHEDLDESLPSYEQAAADFTPPYWESSVISPGFEDEVFVDGLPVGSVLNFIWNFIVSFSFQFIGFFLTYLLHTSHGSKEGSRAGLGLTFMNFGYNLLPVNYYRKSDSPINKFEPNDPNSIDIDDSQTLDGHFYSSPDVSASADDATMMDEASKTPVFAFALIALGLFILLKSVIDYYRARQMEKAILNPNTSSTTAAAAATTTTTTSTITTTTNPHPEEV